MKMKIQPDMIGMTNSQRVEWGSCTEYQFAGWEDSGG
jgi:hypothetical protein